MRPYFRLVLRPILTTALVILALVEIVFLAEQFTGLMDKVVKTGGDALDLIRLLAWEVPEILDLSLPVALLVGVHSAVGAARRNGELVVLSAAGAPSRGLVLGVLLVGLLAGALSFVIAGIVAPAANYAQRVALHQLTAQHVADRVSAPGESGSHFTTNGMDFVATGKPGQPPSLMVRREAGAVPWRFAFAGDWEVTGPDENGDGNFRLGEVTAFGDLPGLDGEGSEARLNRLAAGSVNVGFNMGDILPALDREPRENERPIIPALQAWLAGDDLETVTNPVRIALIWARALLVPVAALTALVAVWGGTIKTVRAAALPLALVGMVLCDLVVRAVIGGIPVGAPLWAACVALPFVLIGLPLVALFKAGEALIRPGRG
ncbi:LptF/LptG family permease [Pseudooceanicola sp. LIPI14-2-Ac024]|uniref:LptF/LptG family permease n=1 Tax=Pseudooceanicola sp. LIPI14-2-Ac024 TaxID=3344875 RepID=UPI0035CFC395